MPEQSKGFRLPVMPQIGASPRVTLDAMLTKERIILAGALGEDGRIVSALKRNERSLWKKSFCKTLHTWRRANSWKICVSCSKKTCKTGEEKKLTQK